MTLAASRIKKQDMTSVTKTNKFFNGLVSTSESDDRIFRFSENKLISFNES